MPAPRFNAERASLAERYRREQNAVQAANGAAAAARVTLGSADDVAAAIAQLPGARAEVERLEAIETAERRMGDEARTQRTTVLDLERPWERANDAWQAQRNAAVEQVAELEARGKAGTSVCQACGQAIGQATALEQLAAARAAVKAIAAAEPKKPLAIDRAQAALTRTETKLRDAVAYQPALIGARAHLRLMERTAARDEAITAARAALEAAAAAKASAEAELARIRDAGQTVATALTAARATVAGVSALVAEHAGLQRDALGVRGALELLEAQRRSMERALAGIEAALERRAQLVAERDGLAALTEALTTKLARLRKVAFAFGVKGIPARIVEKVLPELGRYANDMLEQLVPGASIEIRAQRAAGDGEGVIESIDLVYRDDAGERAMDRPSGGETTAVSLALAIGLNRLNARRSGSAICLLVVDEPDGLDVPGRRAFGQALRRLAHGGELERVVLITHTPDLVDYADAVWQFSKNGHGSQVEQVA